VVRIVPIGVFDVDAREQLFVRLHWGSAIEVGVLSENGHLSTLVRREDWQGVAGESPVQ
jgi:hypothetical protein